MSAPTEDVIYIMATHKYTKQPVRYVIDAYPGGQVAEVQALLSAPQHLAAIQQPPRTVVGCWSADRTMRASQRQQQNGYYSK